MIGWVIALTSEETLPWFFIAPRLRPRRLTPVHRNSKALGITAIYHATTISLKYFLNKLLINPDFILKGTFSVITL